MEASDVQCRQLDEDFLNFKTLRLSLLPWKQSLQIRLVDDGFLAIHTSYRPWSGIKSFQMEMSKIDMKLLVSLAMAELRRQGQPVMIQPELEGLITGELDIPLGNWHQSSGEIQTNLENFRLPQQALTDFVGLRELAISPAEIRLSLNRGLVEIQSIQLRSASLSLVVEGNWNLTENFDESTGDLRLRWQVQTSDAIRRSLFGPQLLNLPCPTPDSEKFCVKRFTRAAEIQEFTALIRQSLQF
jgi:hypothetical protein